jgi:hypothetical protein
MQGTMTCPADQTLIAWLIALLDHRSGGTTTLAVG